jgi:hypothetical protein
LQPLVLHTFLIAGRCYGSAIASAGNEKRMYNQSLQFQFELLMMGGVSPETC